MEEAKLKWQSRDEMAFPTNALQSLLESYVRTSKNMGEAKFDAWIYGIIAGWDDAAYVELARRHSWSEEEVEYNKLLHQNYNKAWELFMENIDKN